MMVWSTEMTPSVAKLIPSTHTALEDCTTAVSNVATTKASNNEPPVPSTISPNQGWSASGAAESLSSTRPSTIMAPPNKDAATGLYLDALSLTITALAIPRTYSATSLMSKVTTNTSSVMPTFPPRMTAKLPLVEMSPDLRILTTMKVRADMLWVMTAATVPQANAAIWLPVHRLAITRIRRVANALRFSVRSHIPTKNIPRPPTIPPISSIIELIPFQDFVVVTGVSRDDEVTHCMLRER